MNQNLVANSEFQFLVMAMTPFLRHNLEIKIKTYIYRYLKKISLNDYFHEKLV